MGNGSLYSRDSEITEKLNTLLMHPISKVLQEVPTRLLINNLQIHSLVNELNSSLVGYI